MYSKITKKMPITFDFRASSKLFVYAYTKRTTYYRSGSYE